MLLKKEQVQPLARQIGEALKKSGCTLKISEARFFEKIENVISKNLQDEMDVENQVRKLMEQYQRQIGTGEIDPQRMYQMMKKQVAKEKKFIL